MAAATPMALRWACLRSRAIAAALAFSLVAAALPAREADVLRQTDPNAGHRNGVLDYTPFRCVGHIGGDPEGHDRRWGDLWGYEYDGTDPDRLGTVYAYVGDDATASGVAVFDITDPARPRLAGTYAPPEAGGLQLRDLEVHDGIGYFSSNDGGGVHIVDVRADPVDPPLLRRLTSADGGADRVHRLSVDVTAGGTFLYEAGLSSGVYVFDVSEPRDPSSIVELAHLDDPCHEALAKGGRLYISHASTVTIYDVTGIRHGNATLLARFASGSGTHSSYPSESGEYLYVGHEGGTRDLRVYDLRDLSGVTEIVAGRLSNDHLGAGSLSNVHNQFVRGSLLFNAWSEAGLTVHALSDPRAPALLGTFDTDATDTPALYEGAFGVYPLLGPDRVLVSDRASGLWIVDITPAPHARRALFRRGDVDGLGSVNIADGIHLLTSRFRDQRLLLCDDAADANDDGELDLSDAVFIFTFLFRGGSPPASPGALDCGPDPTGDALDCFAQGGCRI